MRDLSGGFITEINADTLRPCLLVRAEFDSGVVTLWSGIGDLVYGGETYQGGGALLGISEVKETQNLEASGVKTTLSGIPSEYVALALLENYSGRPIQIFFAVIDSMGGITAVEIFGGQMDLMDIQENGDTASITISSESSLIRLKRAANRTYTPEDQKLRYADDKFFDYVPTLQDKQIVWGVGVE